MDEKLTDIIEEVIKRAFQSMHREPFGTIIGVENLTYTKGHSAFNQTQDGGIVSYTLLYKNHAQLTRQKRDIAFYDLFFGFDLSVAHSLWGDEIVNEAGQTWAEHFKAGDTTTFVNFTKRYLFHVREYSLLLKDETISREEMITNYIHDAL